MTVEEITARGYKEYPRGIATPSGVDRCFQKRFSDNVGKKYFVDAYLWHPLDPYDGVGCDWEYEVYLRLQDGDHPLRVQYYGGCTLDEAEANVEALFQTGLFRYYERWEDC